MEQSARPTHPEVGGRFSRLQVFRADTDVPSVSDRERLHFQSLILMSPQHRKCEIVHLTIPEGKAFEKYQIVALTLKKKNLSQNLGGDLKLSTFIQSVFICFFQSSSQLNHALKKKIAGPPLVRTNGSFAQDAAPIGRSAPRG